MQLFKNFALRTTFSKNSSGGTSFVTLQRPLPGDINFFSGFFIPFQNSNTVSVFCSGIRSHKPGCPRADHNYIFHLSNCGKMPHLYFQRYKRLAIRFHCGWLNPVWRFCLPPAGNIRRDTLPCRRQAGFYRRRFAAPSAI